MHRSAHILTLLLLGTSSLDTAAQPLAEDAATARPADISTCDLIESSAAANGLPAGYFTRLIWRESSFRAWVVSPVGAQGIAQFMPGTAAERGLADPFDPLQAIPASAELLKALVDRFGNPGLAAAAYNGGPSRVEDWLAGRGGLPWETRNYVAAVTGRTAEEWRDQPADLPGEGKSDAAPESCLEALVALDAPQLTTGLPATEVDMAEWQPWGVQLAGNFSQSRALASYRMLQERHAAVLADLPPLIVRQRNPSLGPRPTVNIRVPAPTRDAAENLCGRLRDQGAACIVLRNRGGPS